MSLLKRIGTTNTLGDSGPGSTELAESAAAPDMPVSPTRSLGTSALTRPNLGGQRPDAGQAVGRDCR